MHDTGARWSEMKLWELAATCHVVPGSVVSLETFGSAEFYLMLHVTCHRVCCIQNTDYCWSRTWKLNAVNSVVIGHNPELFTSISDPCIPCNQKSLSVLLKIWWEWCIIAGGFSWNIIHFLCLTIENVQCALSETCHVCI